MISNVDSGILVNIAKDVGIPEGEHRRFQDFVTNVVTMREELINKFLDPRRKIETECGYPDTITPEMYHRRYERDGIAARVVEVMSREAFQIPFYVYENENKRLTPFEKAEKEMRRGLAGRKSWYAGDTGTLLRSYFKEADIQASLGRYSILFLGFDDQSDVNEPVEPTEGMKLEYIRIYPETHAKIKELDNDPKSKRYGEPVIYTLTSYNPSNYQDNGLGFTQATQERDVHWSRVIHVSKTFLFHIPEMQQVFNYLLGLDKLHSGAPEMYWRGAFPGLSIETDPRLGGDVDYNPTEVKTQLERYMDGLQRYLALNGFIAKSLAPQVVDPSPQIRVLIEAICIKLGIPIRIFMGSERGELASTQDDASWNDRVRQYEEGHITPNIICQFYDRLILLKVLPEPKEGYQIYWPDLDSQTEDGKATIALKMSQAIGTYLSQGGENLLTPYWFLVKILKFTEEEAKVALEDTMKALDGDSTSPKGSVLLSKAEGVKALLEVFKLAKEGGITDEHVKQVLLKFYGMSDSQAQEFLADGLPTSDPEPSPTLIGEEDGQDNPAALAV